MIFAYRLGSLSGSRRRGGSFAFLALITAVFTLPLVAEPARIALVVGNAAYAGDIALKNPVNDATDIAQSLKSVGWTVTLITDADRRVFNRAVTSFRDALV
jgi:hypothetical protein